MRSVIQDSHAVGLKTKALAIHVQKKAIEMGIPYQALISGIIHRYIEGDLTSKTG